MNFAEFFIIAFGGIATVAAIVALIAEGFRKPGAAFAALAAGIAPWVFFGGMHGWLPATIAIAWIGLAGSVPLFLLAAILYRRGTATPNQNVAIGACITGLIAGLAYGLLLGKLMAS